MKTKDDKENKLDSKLETEESEQKNDNSAKVEVVKDSTQKERKAKKETERPEIVHKVSQNRNNTDDHT